jgi:arylsulfatase A-like enzyme
MFHSSLFDRRDTKGKKSKHVLKRVRNRQPYSGLRERRSFGLPPNILLITSDQQHWDTLGISNPQIKTPALDRLANEGVVFTRAYCSNPTCSPSRASIITGMYPAWHHCWTIGVKLPEDVPTVGEVLQEHGYSTTLIGKAHFQPLCSTPDSPSLESQPTLRDLDFWRGFHGPWYGFEHVEVARNHADESHVGQHYAIWMEEKGLRNWADYFQDWPPNPEKPEKRGSWALPAEYHYTTWMGERTVANLERCCEECRPFFLWCSFQDPHPPLLVSEPWASMYHPDDIVPGRIADGEFERLPPHFAKTQEEYPDFGEYWELWGPHGFHSHLIEERELRADIAVYYGMISFMDLEIGRILETLDRLGQTSNTLVIFASDHGHFLGQHGLIAKGAFHYEDMIKVPMIVRYPEKMQGGRTTDALQSHVDFAPTFLGAAGITIPGWMQGVNQFGTWCGGCGPVRDHVIVENKHEPPPVHLRTYVDSHYKITVYREYDYGELFDLEEDPAEHRNLWDDPASAKLKQTLMLRFIQAEMKREPTRMPRVWSA